MLRRSHTIQDKVMLCLTTAKRIGPALERRPGNRQMQSSSTRGVCRSVGRFSSHERHLLERINFFKDFCRESAHD
jgi:hypothetical protein